MGLRKRASLELEKKLKIEKQKGKAMFGLDAAEDERSIRKGLIGFNIGDVPCLDCRGTQTQEHGGKRW